MSENTPLETPTGLFDYIAGQQFTAASPDETVNLSPDDPPVNTQQTVAEQAVSAGRVDNAPAAPAQTEGTDGVTPNEQAPYDAGEISRLRQENEALRRSYGTSISSLALVAKEAKQREDALFERSIQHLSDEDQEAERQAREVERIRGENEYLRMQEQNRTAREEEQNERIMQGLFAQEVANRLQLGNDPRVMGLLMESVSPAEMVFRAQRLAQFNHQTAIATQQQQAAQAVQRNVHVAGGEYAPAAPPKKAEERTGNLIDMMRERQYEAVPQNF